MAKCDEYVSRYSVCKNCSNEVVDCGREKCPVYKAPTADVVPKSEVIDEFASRLKRYYDSLKGKAPSTATIVYHIDQIAREMKGEKKDEN